MAVWRYFDLIIEILFFVIAKRGGIEYRKDAVY